jgi:uncharacterized protein GlcG (DUF336 family)
MEKEFEALRKRRRMPYISGMTLKIAQKMINAGIKEADVYGIPVAIAISDSGGNLLAFNRMENAMLCSIQIAMDKAYTAVYGKCHTADWGNRYRSGSLVPLFFHERWVTFAAGFPLIKDGTICGGIGVSGAVSEDLYVARAVIKAGGFDPDDADAALKQVELRNRKKGS